MNVVDIPGDVWYDLVMEMDAELERVARWYEDFAGTPEVCNDVVAYAVAHLGMEGRKGNVFVGDDQSFGVWHCWLVSDGQVVDPTVGQFDGEHVSYPEGEPFEVTWEVERIG